MKFEIYQSTSALGSILGRPDWRWRLRARNGRIIADSGEGYLQKARCQSAIRRLISGVSEAKVEVLE